MNFNNRFYFLGLALALSLGACADDSVDNNVVDQEGIIAPPLTPRDTLLQGAPDNSELPTEGKADAVYPPKFEDLVVLQSPVQNQGGRGVCSVFSTIGLMEHLYIKEGTYLTPDFSEQYLQWSAKFEVGSFRNTEGSTGAKNLEAISRFGVVEEDVWPYESRAWSTSNDPECTGDKRPTRCYTNGEPPAEAAEAEKFTLPTGRWLSTRTDDIKAFMTQKGQAVIVGLDFFYQSWNHGASPLKVNSGYSRKGYVLYPNEDDRRESLKNRAGHSILLVGWDDTLEVERLDKDGKVMLDENGEPMVEKGFFIFKNSWGTGSFGSENPNGDGYGYISQKYVAEYGSGRVADLPEIEPKVEICGDGIDNDGNGFADCEDDVCAESAACQEDSNTKTYTNSEALEIPDNDSNGAVSTIDVEDFGAISEFTVTVDITHAYQGDLDLMLVHPNGSDIVILEEASNTSGAFEKRTYVVEEFQGLEAQGTYELYMWDESKYDAGTLNEWTIEVTF
ncbi:proprotein convertase P-domain-containing protein [Bradymonas sediminis]|uniref:Uncharacterized protein n=1 Tax=Bradymonas sediminis TaxID=1548548 RepID=A0A2Z4FLS0_9DELT|nr:proprotein convertase P-domain-containing protein [Bradymonas sediminis]AWV89929.1 hypothetical protein DN745_11500 [Bradymonas sediminis]TDP62151.1 papain like protease [Bradymonas sediminis]